MTGLQHKGYSCRALVEPRCIGVCETQGDDTPTEWLETVTSCMPVSEQCS